MSCLFSSTFSMNFSFQFPVIMRWFCSDWTLFIYIRSCFFVVALIKKKMLQLLFITCIVSLEMMGKSVTWDVSQGMASRIACKKINSSENCVLGWLSLQSCSYFLRNRALESTLTLTLKQNSLRKKMDPDPDPEFYWHPAEMEKRLK